MSDLKLDRYRRADLVYLSMQMESLLVACNLRGMGTVRERGYSGYLLRAVETLLRNRSRVAIVSGFPVGDTYETDGPAGAVALAQGLLQLESSVALLGVDEYCDAFSSADLGLPAEVIHRVDRKGYAQHLANFVGRFRPTLIIFIEVPGRGADGCYRNMRFENVGAETLPWEELLKLVDCPTLAFADGGNELGMGRIQQQLQGFPVSLATATTDELVIADVSNWAVYGTLALASACTGQPLLRDFDLSHCLEALNRAGFVDGVTKAKTPTEDGLSLHRSLSMLDGLRALSEPVRQVLAAQPSVDESVNVHDDATMDQAELAYS